MTTTSSRIEWHCENRTFTHGKLVMVFVQAVSWLTEISIKHGAYSPEFVKIKKLNENGMHSWSLEITVSY